MGQLHQGAEVSTKVCLTANQQHTGAGAVVQNFCLPLEMEKHLGGDMSPKYSNNYRSYNIIMSSHPSGFSDHLHLELGRFKNKITITSSDNDL